MSPRTAKEIFRLIDLHISIEEIKKWSSHDRARATTWAYATYLNDTEIIKVPKIPVFLERLMTRGENNKTI